MTYCLFIDDERYPPDDGKDWIIARNEKDVVVSLIDKGMPSFISFDHDLGRDENTGYDIAKLLVKLDIEDDNFSFPNNFSYYVHSQNPVGKENIIGYLDNYLNFKKDEKC